MTKCYCSHPKKDHEMDDLLCERFWGCCEICSSCGGFATPKDYAKAIYDSGDFEIILRDKKTPWHIKKILREHIRIEV